MLADKKITLFWFRRDLRLTDNAGLYNALKASDAVLPLFIFDQEILDDLEDKKDKRVNFIYQTLKTLREQLHQLGTSILVEYGNPLEIFKTLIKKYKIAQVYANHDYEPYAIQRDTQIADFLKENNIQFFSFKDQVIFEKDEILNKEAKPYGVFTPYSKRWKEKLNKFYTSAYPTESFFANFYKTLPVNFPTLKDIGFECDEFAYPLTQISDTLIVNYQAKRDYPALEGNSHLGIHLRFGTISIRQLVNQAKELSETFLNELIWREFFMMILWHHPQVVTQAYQKAYDNIAWRNNTKEFECWCEGKTGYPIVDAGMRELNATGYMHNRVRMIAASFLVKSLLIDWRWGEAYFAKKLLDFELASNNGNWQWVAGTGADAAPYFRVFNPSLQTKKFDNELIYIKKWIPELNTLAYPPAIVNHDLARQRALDVYKKALGKS